jgi:hypothetical protein
MARNPLMEAVNSILTEVSAIAYSWDIEQPRDTYLFQLVGIWNNQVDREKEGEGYSFCKPSCFVEILQIEWEQLNMGAKRGDLKLKFHLVAQMLDNEGNFDKNVEVLEFRDRLLNGLYNFSPDFCNTLQVTGEEQDTNHTHVYHYTIDAKCNIVDTKGAFIDADGGHYIEKAEDTTLPDITATYVENYD